MNSPKKPMTREERNRKRRAYYQKNHDKIRAQNNASARRRAEEKRKAEGTPPVQPKPSKPKNKGKVLFGDNPDREKIISAIMAEDDAPRKGGKSYA